MGENFSIERRKLIETFGGKVVLTSSSDGAAGRVKEAQEFAHRTGAFFSNQYSNFANPKCHRDTTAQEILKQFEGSALDYFVCGWGSGGTLSGVGQCLKSERPTIQIVAAQPSEVKSIDPGAWKPHQIQGWAPNFVPAVFNASIADRTILVEYEEAAECAAKLARVEGILCGISSGAALTAALRLAADVQDHKVILTILPDTGERYLSTLRL